MERMKTRKNKFLVILMLFMILFSNFGYTIAAIATSDEFEVISKGFFQKDEVKFNAYFEDENGKKITEITENVNNKGKLVIEVLPQVEGYLKTGSIRAVSSDDDNVNFNFTSVTENLLSERRLNNIQNSLKDALVNNEENKGEVENTTQSEVVENDVTNNVETNTLTDALVENTVSLEDMLVQDGGINPLTSATQSQGANANTVNENTVATNTTNEVTNNPLLDVLSDSTTNTVGTETVTPNEEDVAEEDKLVNEDEIIERITNVSRLEEEMRNAILDIKLASENEISLSNIIDDTKIEIEFEYNQGEKFSVADLCKKIKLQMSGTYINRDLEEVKVGKEEEITVGWEYTKDFTLESEYTKFSPFELEDIKGTIVENKITVTRDIEDEKYLPVKSTRLEVVAPKVNGKAPIAVDVLASKLMATRGEDAGYVTFDQSNWRYDDVNGIINVFVENDNNVYSKGSDEYVIIYRYADYVDSENSNLSNNVRATVTEYSGTENNNIVKEINDSQDIKVDVGELVTYSISANEDKINKAKIYANYNSDVALYETIFTNQVNVNVLTSDVMQQLKLDCTKDIYKDANGVELEAKGIEYKQISFNYSEISELLSDGGEIVITNASNETLYVLNKDVITKEEDCTISLNGANGIMIFVNNITKNGTINFELTKAIKKCNYDKVIFKSIRQIESRISAEVKYMNIEERLELQTIGVVKLFEESQTSATLSVNRELLSTVNNNENVEMKIQLNNDKETSDLYIDPSFEVVFPKYVKEVTIESINLLNDCGLRVNDFETYTENDIVKMRIELKGTQTTFSENSITNGTNIIINANIKVDEYAPAREDQMKLYYCNEGVATYQSQTKWSIKKQIPNGILKTTNGFDVEVIKYQAPSGLIAINGIANYDGNLSEVRSVKQGTVTKEIPINAESRIATMELLALNNTENTCSDVVLLGRVPFKGNKNVISNEELGTTTDTRMVDIIKEDIQNTNTVEIYYSTNADANKNLEDINNGWTTSVADLSSVKSYMIVVKGEVAPGAALRYTYDFEIPANLPYEAKIAGSFASYYNNQKDEAVVYESSAADEVCLVTEKGPRIEARLNVDVGNGTEVGECRYLTYTLEVENTGSITAENVKIIMPIPENAIFCVKTTELADGNNNYIIDSSTLANTWNVKELKPGDKKNYEIVVKTSNLVNGFSNEYVVAKVALEASNLGIVLESNEVRNKIVESKFNIIVHPEFRESISTGTEFSYFGEISNIAEKNLRNVKAVWTLPSTVEFIDSDESDVNNGWNYDPQTRSVTMEFAELKSGEIKQVPVKVRNMRGNRDYLTNYLTILTEDGTSEKSSDISILYRGVEIEAHQTTNIAEGTVLEGEEVEFYIVLKNGGNGAGDNIRIYDEISPYLTNVSAKILETNASVSVNNNLIDYTPSSLGADTEITLRIKGKAADLNGENKTIINKAKIFYNVNDSFETNEQQIVIRENTQKDETPAVNNNYTNKPTTLNDIDSSDNSENPNSPNYSYEKNNNNSNKQEKGIYSISGLVWLDKDRNGKRDNKEELLPSIKVQLYKADRMIATTTTNSKGQYDIKELTAGEYYVVFEYDGDKYTTTSYQKIDVDEALNSKAVESSAGKATSNVINISDSNVSNINMGLQEKEKFDLIIEKFITKAIVTSGNQTEEYKFDNKILGKVEIKASKLKGAKVDLEYNIKVSNVGDTSGKAITIADILPEDMSFDESKNAGWVLGTDGILYNNTLKDTVIAPGQSKELKLVLTRTMNENNTGVISNKVQLMATESSNDLIDVVDNNVATQEMMILIKTGFELRYIVVIITTLLAIMLITYCNRDKIINTISGKNNNYKNKTKDIKKISIKKKYK